MQTVIRFKLKEIKHQQILLEYADAAQDYYAYISGKSPVAAAEHATYITAKKIGASDEEASSYIASKYPVSRIYIPALADLTTGDYNSGATSVSFTEQSLELSDHIGIRVYYTGSPYKIRIYDAYNKVERIYLSVKDGDFLTDDEGNTYVLINDLMMHQSETVFECTAYDISDNLISDRVYFSFQDYAISVIKNSDNDYLKDIVQALINYSKAVYAKIR